MTIIARALRVQSIAEAVVHQHIAALALARCVRVISRDRELVAVIRTRSGRSELEALARLVEIVR